MTRPCPVCFCVALSSDVYAAPPSALPRSACGTKRAVVRFRRFCPNNPESIPPMATSNKAGALAEAGPRANTRSGAERTAAGAFACGPSARAPGQTKAGRGRHCNRDVLDGRRPVSDANEAPSLGNTRDRRPEGNTRGAANTSARQTRGLRHGVPVEMRRAGRTERDKGDPRSTSPSSQGRPRKDGACGCSNRPWQDTARVQARSLEQGIPKPL